MDRDCKKDPKYNAAMKKYADGGIASGIVIKGPAGSAHIDYKKSGSSKEAGGSRNLWTQGFADGGAVKKKDDEKWSEVEVFPASEAVATRGKDKFSPESEREAYRKEKRYTGYEDYTPSGRAALHEYNAKSKSGDTVRPKKGSGEVPYSKSGAEAAQKKQREVNDEITRETHGKANRNAYANGGPVKPKVAAVKVTAKPKFANGGKVKKFANGGIEGESSSGWVQDEQAKLQNRLATASDPRNEEPAFHASVASTESPGQADQDLANAAAEMRTPTPVSAVDYPDFGEDKPSGYGMDVGGYKATPAAKAGAAAGTAAAIADKAPKQISKADDQREKNAMLKGGFAKGLQGIAHLAGTVAHAKKRGAAAGRGEDPNAVPSDIPAAPKSTGPNPEKARYDKLKTKADADWESVKNVGSKIAALTDLRPAGQAMYDTAAKVGKAWKTGAAKLANKSMGMKVYSEGDDEEKKG